MLLTNANSVISQKHCCYKQNTVSSPQMLRIFMRKGFSRQRMQASQYSFVFFPFLMTYPYLSTFISVLLCHAAFFSAEVQSRLIHSIVSKPFSLNEMPTYFLYFFNACCWFRWFSSSIFRLTRSLWNCSISTFQPLGSASCSSDTFHSA